ncbi:unnamed protein product [Linum tenue]|uniref:Uncharacterized protein n=1 Tax=Linum tenue TaxID=586396 RepID=A0AAV0MD90_9ROSI|nr:unnamed protein product [Linum tenue]
MMAQFLLLMVGLDKVYYSPLGKFMDERDAEREGHVERGEAAGGAEGDAGGAGGEAQGREEESGRGAPGGAGEAGEAEGRDYRVVGCPDWRPQ